MIKVCAEEKVAEAKYVNMWDQKWAVWECDAKFNNVLYKNGKPLVVDNLSFMLGYNSWSAWDNDPYRWHSPICNDFPIIARIGDSQFSICNLFNSIRADTSNSIKFSVGEDYCVNNSGFFEILMPIGKNTDIENNSKTIVDLTNTIVDMTKAFHGLFGKFSSLEREQDGMQKDFSDFKSAMCVGRERDCEELIGKIRAEREDGDNGEL